MKTAIITDKRTGESYTLDADAFEARFAGNLRLKIPSSVPDWRARYMVVDPDTAAPLVFHRTHWRHGYEERVSACFARAAGFGDHDHVFDHDHQSLPQAVASGKKVLLSLNTDLSYRVIDYRGLNMPGVDTLENFISHNRQNYISVSVSSAADAIDTVKTLNKMQSGLPQDRLSVLYRGAVMDWAQFYLGANDDKLCTLYDDLQSLRAGLPRGETRVIGFPRLMRFVPTKKMQEQEDARGIKGNFIKRENIERLLLSHLIFSDDREKSADHQQAIRHIFAGSARGLYVLAAPSVTRGVNEGKLWQNIRWIINDFERQTVVPHIHVG